MVQSQESAPQGQPPAPDVPTWNGELSALEKEQWYASLDEGMRKNVRSGVETRLRNYEKGVQSKLQSWSQEKKDLESKLSRAERAQKLYETLSQGEEDPRVAEHQARADELQRQLDQLVSERDGYKTKWEQREEAEAKATAQRIFDEHTDIMSNDAMSEKFIKLLTAGLEPEEAAAMVRAVVQEASPKVPKDVALMGRGDMPSGRSDAGIVPGDWRSRVDEAASKALRLHDRR